VAIINFSNELQKLTGEATTRVDERIYKDIVNEISRRYPSVKVKVLMEMAVAIDGEIVHAPLLEYVAPDSELHFLYRISGG
jgi:hypothetical protein